MSNNRPEGFLTILGDAYTGETLTARPNGVKDADGINYATRSYQWLRDGDPIFGATQQTYAVTSADIGSRLSVEYSYTDNRGNKEVVVSSPEPTVPAVRPTDLGLLKGSKYSDPDTDNANNKSPIGFLAILGDAVEGETLYARTAGITDADGIRYNTAVFQWLRDGEPIPGATSETYTVGVADRGTNISLKWSYTDSLGTKETIVSPSKPTVPGTAVNKDPQPIDLPSPSEDSAPGASTPTKAPTFKPPFVINDNMPAPTIDLPTPTIDTTNTPVPTNPTFDGINNQAIGKLIIYGFPVQGATLIARTDAVYDREGFDRDGGWYQWLRDGEPIEGATSKNYVVGPDDWGTSISVRYSFIDFSGNTEIMYSEPEPLVPFPEGFEPEGNIVDPSNGELSRNVTTEQANDGEVDTSPISIETTPQDDVVTITAAMSSVNGLAGDDTAVLAGDQTNYTLTFSPDSITVTDRSADGLGSVELINFEFLDFGVELPVFNSQMSLSQFGGHTSLGEEAFESFVEMYIAYFNRAPDAIGLSFWGTAFANGTTLEEIASQFAEQPETIATYPADASSVGFVAAVYENVLGRSPDIEGLRFWREALDEGAVGRGEFILEILRGAKAEPAGDVSQAFLDRQAADQAYLEAKTDLGAYFAVHRGMSNVEDASMVMELYDGSSESLSIAIDAVDTLFAAAQDPVSGDFLMPLVGVIEDPFAI